MYCARTCAASEARSVVEGRSIARCLGMRARRAAARRRRAPRQRLEPPALCGDAEIRLAQARAQGIALLELGPEPAGELGDARAHGRELGFRLRGVGDFGGRGACGGADAQAPARRNRTPIFRWMRTPMSPTGRKHTSLVPAAILARPKKPDFFACNDCWNSSAIIPTLRARPSSRPWPFSLPRSGSACPEFRRAVLHAGRAAHESGRAGARSAGKESFEAGHIADARNVPAAELAGSADTLKKWREKTVITYCDSGVSGAEAARTLAKLGFTKVFNLDGGLNGWIKDNLPLARDRTRDEFEARFEMSQPDIVIYVAGWCPYCQRARSLLSKKGIAVPRDRRRRRSASCARR